MSDRYTRLYTLQKRDYIHDETCPVVCIGGGLLYDNQQNRVLGQLKFKSLSNKIINTVVVRIDTYDEKGNKLKGIDSFSYTNIDINTGEEFGSNKAIILKDSNTSKFVIEILSVDFNDGQIWISPNTMAVTAPDKKIQSVVKENKYNRGIGKKIAKIVAAIGLLTVVGFGVYSFLHVYGKNEAVVAAENAIEAIGTVTIDSLNSIENAEKLYGILTDSEKEKVKNRIILVDAREDYELILQEKNEELRAEVYQDAKYAFEQLKIAANLCIDGMDDIYGAWYFGIYDADDASSSLFTYDMHENTPHLSIKELDRAIDDLGYSTYTLKSEFSACTQVAVRAHQNKGTYTKISNALNEAEDILQKLTDKYSDYEYYPKLKEYYSKVLSYSEFFWSPTGSFKQLADTVNDYENTIRTYESDISFLFTK